ncbi:hypothetical protein BD414DRAFT_269256 [Trametes punicea]|nr:hypothetical protein BD414DRAFT_269256 [Trametes punicea]
MAVHPSGVSLSSFRPVHTFLIYFILVNIPALMRQCGGSSDTFLSQSHTASRTRPSSPPTSLCVPVVPLTVRWRVFSVILFLPFTFHPYIFYFPLFFRAPSSFSPSRLSSSCPDRLLAFSYWSLRTLSRSLTLQNCSMCVYGCLVEYNSLSNLICRARRC